MLMLLTTAMAFAAGSPFDFQQDLFGPPVTLGIQVASIDLQTGLVSVSGVDSSRPSTPFTWNWGDGNVTDGFFPQQHTYIDHSHNHIVEVTAHYAGGGTSQTEAVVFFAAPAVNPVSCPPELLVTIPDYEVALGAHCYQPPTGLTFFTGAAFPVVPRATVEYVLTVAAMLQMDYANHDVFFPESALNQVILRDPQANGMSSLWNTTPVGVRAGDYAFGANNAYSSCFHEMGHNVSLNSPAAYYYGGKIDGPANAIFCESMAQIFQHATASDMLNHADGYGLDPALATAIGLSAHASMRIVHDAYTRYVNGGKHFASWNDPATPGDETFDTFMTIAYVFCSTAEQAGAGYRAPLKRMMELLQLFNSGLQQRYDQNHNTPAADAFRATLMVAAMSHGFGRDLRQQFRDLNFPIDDDVFAELKQTLMAQKDTDHDGLTNVSEEILGTSPTNPDTDRDGVPDGIEVQWGYDPTDPSSTPNLPSVTASGLAVLTACLAAYGARFGGTIDTSVPWSSRSSSRSPFPAKSKEVGVGIRKL